MDHPHKPNLFIIGAMKSGTSSLHVYLAEHPEIFMCEPKEPSYFVSREDLKIWYPWMEEQGIWKGEDRYLQLFAQAGNRKVIASPAPVTPSCPRSTASSLGCPPLRPRRASSTSCATPVERTISHYWHMVRNRDERRDMLTAIKEEPHFRDVSHYAMQLAPYFETWGRESVYTMTTEELSGDPEGSVRRIFAWLGVDPKFVPKSIHTPEHVTPEELRQAAGWAGLFQIRQSGLYRALRPAIPEGVRSFVTGLTRRSVKRRDVESGPVKEFLRPIQLEQTRELSALLGREFPEWKTLYGRKG